jgi:probable rRNA maturation factor
MNASIRTSDVPLSDARVDAIIVEIANQQSRAPVNENRLREGVLAVIAGEGLPRANISLAVVDDSAIQELNRRFLEHDWPTDVLSFVLEQGDGFVEGEIILSADTAAEAAGRYGWRIDDEMLLYTIHGALHLMGYDDQSSADQTVMRQREAFYLAKFGLSPRFEERQP